MANRVPQFCLLLTLAAASSGCASRGYLGDRARDAADVFTLTLGTGAGVKARIGPAQVGLIENSDLIGLRAGKCFWNGSDLEYNDEVYTFPFPLRGVRVKGWGLPYGIEGFSHGRETASHKRGKDVFAVSTWPCYIRGYGAPFLTQIEVEAGLGLTARLGLNPGEFLDFLTGWFGVDLYHDDLSRRPAGESVPKVPDELNVWGRRGQMRESGPMRMPSRPVSP